MRLQYCAAEGRTAVTVAVTYLRTVLSTDGPPIPYPSYLRFTELIIMHKTGPFTNSGVSKLFRSTNKINHRHSDSDGKNKLNGQKNLKMAKKCLK